MQRQRSKLAPPTMQQLHKMSYREYVETAHWKRVVKSQIRHAQGRCQRCNCTCSGLHVVHLDFRKVGREGPDDIIALCPDCVTKHYRERNVGGENLD